MVSLLPVVASSWLAASQLAAWAVANAAAPLPAIGLPAAEPAPHAAWVGAAASPGQSGVLAIWTDEEVYLSDDDGRTFRPVLRGPETVRAVALNEAGDLFVARANRLDQVRTAAPGTLHVLSRDGQRTSTSLPLGTPTHLFVGGESVGLVLASDDEGDSLILSQDRGQSFAVEDATIGNAGFSAVIAQDGTVSTMTGFEAMCGGGGQSRERRDPVSGQWASVVWSLDAPFDWGVGAGEFAYGVDPCVEGSDARCLQAVGAGHVATVLHLPKSVDWSSLQVSTNGRSTFALSGRYLVKLDGERGRVVDTRAPADLWLTSVDADGRALGLAERSVMRWSPSTGWRALAQGEAAP